MVANVRLMTFKSAKTVVYGVLTISRSVFNLNIDVIELQYSRPSYFHAGTRSAIKVHLLQQRVNSLITFLNAWISCSV